MDTQRTEEESILRNCRPSALPQGLKEQLLASMQDSSLQSQQANTLAGQIQPPPLPRHLHTRLLFAMMAASATPQKKWYSYRRTAVAAVALLLLLGAWLSNEFLFNQAAENASTSASRNNACFAVAERSILTTGEGSPQHMLRDTLTLQDADASHISIRVMKTIPAPIPEEVI